VLLVLFVVLAAVLIWLDHSPVGRNWRPEPEEFSKYHGKKFKVVNVVDGDTIDIDVPDGKYEHTRIRLWGIDTPEKDCYFGPQATEFTRKLALGKQVEIYLDRGNRVRGTYGRLLAYVKLPDGRFLNEVLLMEGFAYADLRFRHSFYNKYRQLESLARNHRKGLWEGITRERLPRWLQEKRPELLLRK